MDRKRIVLFVLLLIPMLILYVPVSHAWKQWDCFRWPEKEMTMNIGDLGNDSIDGESWKNIAITSIENWFQYCSPDADFDWKYVDSQCSASTWDLENCSGLGDLGSCSGSGTITLGVTKIRIDGCDIIEADVRLNSQCIDSGWFSLTRALSVMSHEYGHSVGLGHDGDDGLMYGYYQDGIWYPQPDDCEGFYEIYNFYPPSKAINPKPSNGSTEISIGDEISWTNGGGATSYDVYFGTDATPDSGEFKGSQVSTTYDPGLLSYNTTYYWRIDAQNSEGKTNGDIWSFTTERALPIITVRAFDTLASEPGTNTGRYRFARTGLTDSDIAVYFVVSGSAANGIDYNRLSSPINIPVGASYVDVTLIPKDDSTYEGTEIATLTISTNSAYDRGNPYSATVTIQDNEQLPDTTDPTVTITSPTSGSSWSTSSTPLSVGGTASDNVAVASVTWSNNRGGNGACSLSGSSWTASVGLTSGSNVIAITANDTAGNTATDTLTVTYTPLQSYTIATSIQGNGTVTLDPPGGTYDEGTTVTITALPDSGYKFDHWEGDVSGNNFSLVVTVNSDMSVKAVFIDETVTSFVSRFYQLCLGRDPDQTGLNGWVNDLLDGTKTGADVAWGFVFSQEFINRNTTNEVYLTILYKAFFNRNPDPGGWDSWIAELNRGTSREGVLNGFIYAVEFAELCEEYGILAYDGYITKAQREAVEAFVTRFYQLCLNRNPDPAGLDGWTNDLLNQVRTGGDVARGFIYSQEFIKKNTSNSEYLQILYEAFFDRDPDQVGWDMWLAELYRGRDRGEVLNGFIYSTEFSNLCSEYGIKAF